MHQYFRQNYNMDNETTIDSSESEDVQTMDLASEKESYWEALVGLWDDGDSPNIKVIKGGVAEAIDILNSYSKENPKYEQLTYAILSLKTSCDMACTTLRNLNSTTIDPTTNA